MTGGAGFLGSNLCQKLLNLKCYVICIDNFYTGQRKNVQKLLDNKNFKLVEHDIVYPLPLDLMVDEIYNLACPASPQKYQKDPIYTTKINVFGILNVLEVAKRCGAKILQASTSEVYGEPQVNPQFESYRGNVNTIGIRSCYDEGKRCAESIVFDYNRQYGVKTKVIRIFNTYGPNMDTEDGRVISNFIVQALNNKNITVYGDGSQTRSLCYVDDLIEGMVRMMDSKDEILGPINIGNPEEYTILEIARKIIGLTSSNSNIIYEDLPKDDPTQRKPDISLAKEILKWEPLISVDDGILKTIEYFKNLKDDL